MTDQPSNTKRVQFADLLRELFQLNQPELDFGIYRIMHARKDDINRFIEQDLPRIVGDAFKDFQGQDKVLLQAELDKARKAAEDAGFNPEQSPKVQELQGQLSGAVNLGREEGEVYDALITFFNRYYDEGDFISRRVYKDGAYAIPYNGEEVVLHWANKDQYYIKSSETLRDYSFRLNPDNEENPMRVHFRLVDAEAGAQNNNKEAEESKRVFVLDAGQPWEEVPSADPVEQGKELNLRFHYRAATAADWTAAAKKGSTAAAAKKPPTQDHLRQVAVERLLGEVSNLSDMWKQPLAQAYIKANGEPADYTLLQGQLDRYTKKNTFDYYIHKDLGGFLTRELDFYIKNELVRWEDVSALKSQPARLAPLLSKVEVIRTIGEKIITFLAQLEEFQKKLWLKKKFVTEVNFCITLDRVPEELYPVIAKNDQQSAAWVDLFAIDEIPGYSEILTEAFLRDNPNLLLDTQYFDTVFVVRLTAAIENIDEHCDGTLIHSDNFQALKLAEDSYRKRVKCIYIDPPYNTSSSSIPYKNDYKHSAWATLMFNRLAALNPILKEDGAIFVSIDKAERTVLEHAMDEVFGAQNKVEELIWAMNTNNSQAPNYSTNHEYVLVYAKNKTVAEQDRDMFREPKPGFEEVIALITELNPDYPPIEKIEQEIKALYQRHKIEYQEEIEAAGLDWEKEKRNDPWKGLFNYARAEYRDADEKLVPENEACERQATIWVWRESDASMPATKQAASTRDPEHRNFRFYTPLHPVTGKPCTHPKSGWKFAYDDDEGSPDKRSFVSLDRDGRIVWGADEKKIPQLKRMLHEVETNVGQSVFSDYSDGEKQTSALFGRSGIFLAPKHADFVSRFIQHAAKPDSIIVDCFGGSGSTAHAVIKLNREDRGNRKYLLVEMGAYFDTVLKPRVLKAVYSKDWRGGKPLSRKGVSHCIKVLRLESYEDALANLNLKRDQAQHDWLNSKSEQDQVAREAYLLSYMLDVETRGSASLLNVQQFVDPTNYKLKVRNPTGDETKWVNVDLLETFNWLIGLTVDYIAAPIHFDAELSQGEYGRWEASVKRREDGRWWFRTVAGTNRKGQKILIVWRNLPSVISEEPDGLVKDNAVLDAVLIDKLKVRLTESPDDEFDILYVNGDHNVTIPKQRGGGLLEARVKLIEEDFHRLMFSAESH